MKYIRNSYGVDLKKGINLRFKRLFLRYNSLHINQNRGYRANEDDDYGIEEVNIYVLVNLTIADYKEKEKFASLIWKMHEDCRILRDTQIELIDDASIRYCDFDVDVSFEKPYEELIQLYQNMQQWKGIFQKQLIRTTTEYQKSIIFDLTNFVNDYMNPTQKSLTFLMHIRSKDTTLLLDFASEYTDDPYLYGRIQSLNGIGKDFSFDVNSWKNILVQQVNTYTKDAYITYPGLTVQDGSSTFGVSLIYQDKGINNISTKNAMKHSFDFQFLDNQAEIVIEDPTGYVDTFYMENSNCSEKYASLETNDRIYCNRADQSYRVEKVSKEKWYYETIDGKIHLSKIVYPQCTLSFQYHHHRLLKVTNQRNSIQYSYDTTGKLIGFSTADGKKSMEISYKEKQIPQGFTYKTHYVRDDVIRTKEYRTLNISYFTSWIKITHNQTKENMWIRYENNCIKSVAIGYEEYTSIPKYYDYDENYTKISYFGQEIYQYFDHLGRVLYQVNPTDIISCNQYHLSYHNGQRQVITKSQNRIKKQWLENASFDIDNLNDYTIKGKKNSKVEQVREENRKYLRIQKKDAENISIEQTVTLPPADEEIVLSGYYQLNHFRSSANGMIKIELIGTYSKYIDVPIPGASSGTYETIQELAQYNQILAQITLPFQETMWKKFVFPKVNSHYQNMVTSAYTIRITCSGTGYSLGIDDLSVVDTPEVTRSNYIQGGYFLQTDIQKLKGLEIVNQSSGDCIQEITAFPLSMHVNCLLIENVRQCNPYQYRSKTLEYWKDLEGKKGDIYTLCFLMHAYCTENDLPRILFSFSNDEGEYSYEIPVTPNIKTYQYVSVKMKAPLDYQNIEFSVSQSHIYDIRIATIELVKEEELLEYEYNQKKNITQIIGEKRYERYAYDENNQCIQQIDQAFNHTIYQYDDHQRVVQSITNDQVLSQNEYNEQGDCIQQWIGDTEVYQKQVEYMYDDYHQITRTTDAIGQSISYQYDLQGRITSINHSNQLSIQNMYNVEEELKSISFVPQNEQVEPIKYDLTYDGCRRISSFQQNQVHQYSISYDQYGNIKTLKNQDALLQEDTYQKGGLLNSRKLTNNQRYDYTYNGQHQLESISCNHKCKAKYIYQKNQLIQIKNNQDEAIVEYVYDKNNALK